MHVSGLSRLEKRVLFRQSKKIYGNPVVLWSTGSVAMYKKITVYYQHPELSMNKESDGKVISQRLWLSPSYHSPNPIIPLKLRYSWKGNRDPFQWGSNPLSSFHFPSIAVPLFL